MTNAKAAHFPGAEGRIPNFVGAEAAAERLRALEDGKTLFMAVPRLADEHPFFLLDPDHLAASPRTSSSIKGASKSARRVHLDELQVRPAGEIPTTAHDIHLDLVVTPERVVECRRPRARRQPGVRWDELTREKIEAIPILRALARRS